jgi:hypothetical protein
MLFVAGLALSSSAQQGQDTIIQKDGEVIAGTITEDNPGSMMKIRVGPHTTWTLYYSNIQKIQRAGQAAVETGTPAAQPAPAAPVMPAAEPAVRTAPVVPAAPVVQAAPAAPVIPSAPAAPVTPAAEPPKAAAAPMPEATPTPKAPVVDTSQQSMPKSTLKPYTPPGVSSTTISLGVMGGVDFYREYASGTGMTDTTFGSRTGFLAGAILEIQPMPNLSIQPGVVYTSRGSEGGGTTDDYRYLAILVDVKGKLPVTPVWSVYGLVGANLGILLSASTTYQTYDSLDNLVTVTSDLKSSRNNIDLGIEAGIGMEFPTGRVTPFVEGVYYFGLLNTLSSSYVSQIAAEGGPANLYAANRGIEIRAGLKFPLQ